MTIAIIIAIIVSAVVGHELGHVIVAEVCGWKYLGIFWGKAYLGAVGVRFEPRITSDIWKVALGGLAASAFMAVGWMLAWGMNPSGYVMTGIVLNSFILFFNMLPISVADGGQVLAGLRMERAQ